MADGRPTLYPLYRKYKSEYRCVGLFRTRDPVLLLIDPELIKDVMMRNFNNFHDNDLSKYIDKDKEPVFSQNAIAMTGDAWKEKRMDLSPAFTTNKVSVASSYCCR